jgi:two-component system sensor histidine kinase ChiS
VTGKLLIVGGRAGVLAGRLEALGYSCDAAERVTVLRTVARPDAVIIASSARATGTTVEAVRRTPALRAVPIIVDASTGAKGLGALQVDCVAHDFEELDRQVAASVRARRLTEHDLLVRRRLELLLDLERTARDGATASALALVIAARLNEALDCEASFLVLEGDGPRKAWLVDAAGLRTAVELAVSPQLSATLEQRTRVQSQGACAYPCQANAQGFAALLVRRPAPLEQEEHDFVEAVVAALSTLMERRQGGGEVADARRSLEAAYVERYHELVDANNRLKALDRKKNELLAVLSHDLRAPLNVLLGHAHLLVTDPSLTPAAKASSETIQRTSRKVLELIENLLDRSRGQERTVLFPRTLDVAETCQECVQELQILAGEKGIALRVEAPMSLLVLGDEQKIRQVLQNLVTNAMTHAKAVTRIVVAARLKQRPDGDVALVEVRDDGVVQDPNALLLAFERSSGLGLAICRDYVERHGGEIWAEAPPGGGGVFRFTLPLRLEAPSRPVSPRTDVPLVLLADADPVFLRIASMALSGHYRVETARDGNEAIARAKALLPDVIVMGVFMPQRDGLDALRELKVLPQVRDIPVLLVSGTPELSEKLRLLDVGAFDHLTKPFALSTLLTRVAEALARSQRTLSAGPGNDAETGLFDQLGVVNRLQQELSRSSRYARPLTVVSLRPEVAPADARGLAATVRGQLRAPDVAGHLGGGLFVLILPETAPPAATPLVARLVEVLSTGGAKYRSNVCEVRTLGAKPEAVLEQVLT